MSIAVAGATGLVGTMLTRALQQSGHTVVPLSRATGTDLLTGEGLEERLAGVTTVIDVTNSADPSEAAATAFFTTATANLGAAAARAGVEHLLVLSIIGIDQVPGGYYAAKVAQEAAAHSAFGAGTVVLRAAQFHEFAQQCLDWGTEGNQARIEDMPVRPIALTAVVDELVARAGDPGADADIAGPKVEFLPDLVRRLIARSGAAIEVVPQPVDEPVRGGALLGGPDAIVAGPTFGQWLAAR